MKTSTEYFDKDLIDEFAYVAQGAIDSLGDSWDDLLTFAMEHVSNDPIAKDSKQARDLVSRLSPDLLMKGEMWCDDRDLETTPSNVIYAIHFCVLVDELWDRSDQDNIF